MAVNVSSASFLFRSSPSGVQSVSRRVNEIADRVRARAAELPETVPQQSGAAGSQEWRGSAGTAREVRLGGDRDRLIASQHSLARAGQCLTDYACELDAARRRAVAGFTTAEQAKQRLKVIESIPLTGANQGYLLAAQSVERRNLVAGQGEVAASVRDEERAAGTLTRQLASASDVAGDAAESEKVPPVQQSPRDRGRPWEGAVPGHEFQHRTESVTIDDITYHKLERLPKWSTIEWAAYRWTVERLLSKHGGDTLNPYTHTTYDALMRVIRDLESGNKTELERWTNEMRARNMTLLEQRIALTVLHASELGAIQSDGHRAVLDAAQRAEVYARAERFARQFLDLDAMSDRSEERVEAAWWRTATHLEDVTTNGLRQASQESARSTVFEIFHGIATARSRDADGLSFTSASSRGEAVDPTVISMGNLIDRLKSGGADWISVLEAVRRQFPAVIEERNERLDGEAELTWAGAAELPTGSTDESTVAVWNPTGLATDLLEGRVGEVPQPPPVPRVSQDDVGYVDAAVSESRQSLLSIPAVESGSFSTRDDLQYPTVEGGRNPDSPIPSVSFVPPWEIKEQHGEVRDDLLRFSVIDIINPIDNLPIFKPNTPLATGHIAFNTEANMLARTDITYQNQLDSMQLLRKNEELGWRWLESYQEKSDIAAEGVVSRSNDSIDQIQQSTLRLQQEEEDRLRLSTEHAAALNTNEINYQDELRKYEQRYTQELSDLTSSASETDAESTIRRIVFNDALTDEQRDLVDGVLRKTEGWNHALRLLELKAELERAMPGVRLEDLQAPLWRW